MANHETVQDVLDQVVAEGVPGIVIEIKDPAAIRSDAVSCQRPRQHGDGPVSERSATVGAMNGSAIAASGLVSQIEHCAQGDS